MWITTVASGIILSKLFAFIFSLLNFELLTASSLTRSPIFFPSNPLEQCSTYQDLNHLLLVSNYSNHLDH